MDNSYSSKYSLITILELKISIELHIIIIVTDLPIRE